MNKLIDYFAKRTKRTQCFHCGGTVCWDCDYDFEDFGLDGDGIVQCCHCMDCGADIEYRIYLGERDD